MDEGDAGSPPSWSGHIIDKPGAFLLQVIQGDVDRRHGECDVVQPFAPVLEKAPDGSVRRERLQQLDERAPDRDHRFLDSLGFDHLAVQRFDPVAVAISLDGLLQVVHRDRHMVEIQQLHRREAKAPLCQRGLKPVTGSILPVSNPVITGFARTPIGRYNGALAPVRAVELGGAAIAAAVDRSQVDPGSVDEVLFGHVLQAGEGQITARQAAVRGGLPMTVPSVTINKVCLSGMSAIGLAERGIRAGDSKFVIAGGMESMSNAPHVVRELRWGVRIGNAEMVDVMQHDGLFCAFDQCTMGESSDHKNQRLGIGREEQDLWAARSHQRAEEATSGGLMAGEIVPVTVPQPKAETVTVDRDEGIRPGSTPESMAALKPAFISGGTITAGNASQISDGAAALVVADRDAAEASGAPIVAEILAYGQIGGGDATLHERPAEALLVALKRAGLDVADLDLVEINEAFAAVAIWSARMLDLPDSKVNVHGGAVALGHPLGATGARLVVTLINALQARGGGIGAATLCGGGGQGDAIVLKVA